MTPPSCQRPRDCVWETQCLSTHLWPVPRSAAFSRLRWQSEMHLSCTRRLLSYWQRMQSGRPSSREEAVVLQPLLHFTQERWWPPANPGSASLKLGPVKLPFKMLMQKRIIRCIQPQDWFIAVDLKDAYFHVSICPRHRPSICVRGSGMAVQGPPLREPRLLWHINCLELLAVLLALQRSGRPAWLACVGPHRQHCGCLVHQLAGLSTITLHVTTRPPSPPLVSDAAQVTVHSPHPGGAQSCSVLCSDLVFFSRRRPLKMHDWSSAFFLQERLERRLSPSTLKAHVAAITAHHVAVDGRSLGKHDLIVRFLRGARRLNSPRPPLVPSWDLSIVLAGLQRGPFELLDSVELKFLSARTVLLTVLTSIKRFRDL